MPNDRRRFLVAGIAGLATLLMPKISLAGIFHRRSKARNQTTVVTAPVRMCPAYVRWSPTDPSIPDAQKMTPSVDHSITVSGSGLATWVNNGGAFYPSVVDDNNYAQWTVNPNGSTLVQGSGGSPDYFTFLASETGSTAGTSSTITITIALTPSGGCAGPPWRNRPVQYTS
jgi:hypothetical protein